jgi:DNA primase
VGTALSRDCWNFSKVAAMRFSPAFLDELRARLPVSEVVGKRMKLRKAGREWKGLSPFNQEKTPSFFVNDQKAMWFDFSSGKNGNIFDFLMQTEGLSFPEAVERLAGLAGIPLPEVSPESVAREERRKTIYDVLELASKYFESNLASKEGAKARGYLADRGVHASTQIEFRMGYARRERFALKEYLSSQKVSVADMIDAGLLVSGDDIPVPYDRFRDRVIIPIHDQRGRVIAFGGRSLSEDVQPKYLNSPETSVFHKGSNLFNFHRARQAAHVDGSAVVVEGYMDAIAIYQAGLKSVVATLGTSFTEEQISALWRLTPEPVVCFDADRAGVSAAYRSIDRILPALKVGQSFRFAFIQEGKDPDELVRERGLSVFKAILQDSDPLWDVLWKREVHSLVKLDSPDARAALEHKFYAIIKTINDPIVQAQYRGTCRVELSDLFWKTARARLNRDGNKPKRSPITIATKGHLHDLQKMLLGLLVHYPAFLEVKEDALLKVHFEPELRKFHQGLYELLVVSKEISVEIIYQRLSPKFYEVLEDIHGHQRDGLSRGHNLFARLPIIKIDPPIDFVSDCIDHFINVLTVAQMKEELENIIAGDDPLASEAIGERLTGLVRDIQLQGERANVQDVVLAERAKDMRNVLLGPAEYRRLAA